MLTGENKLDGLGIFRNIVVVDAAAAVPDVLVQQVQAGRGGGARLPRHVRHVPGAGHAHRAERVLPRQHAHVQTDGAELAQCRTHVERLCRRTIVPLVTVPRPQCQLTSEPEQLPE